jgi:hypothetical protein
MDYQKIYNSLIERGKTRQKLQCYAEKHHIVPTCIGGPDTEENLVELTPEEHYVAHQLLVRIHPNESKLVYAAHMMCMRPGNKLYGWLRRKHQIFIAEHNKKHSGRFNSQFGTRWITDGFVNRKIGKTEVIPVGFGAGRVSAHTAASIAKISKALSQRKISDQTRKKLSDAKKGKKFSMEHRANLSKSHLSPRRLIGQDVTLSR